MWELLKPSPEDAFEASDHQAPYDANPRAAVLREGPPGLRELAIDEGSQATLAVEPPEWRLLLAVGKALPPTVDKAGFVQLLFTLRVIVR